MSFSIDVNDSQSRVGIDPERLSAIAEDLLREEQVVAAEISVALIDGETMRRLNREHLGHDYDTDVLSFLLECDSPAETVSEGPRGAGKSLEGEVLISTDVAAKSAAEFDWPPADEVTLYLVHGVLHLVGYDDLTPDEKTIMRRREREVLARWDLTPTYAEDEGSAHADTA